MPNSFIAIFCLLHCFFASLSFSDGTQLLIVNNCKFPIWPGILGSASHPPLNDGGFALSAGQEISIKAPKWWSGRIWARTGCCFDESGKGTCQTGDCGGQLRCQGTGGRPPATVVEMTLGTSANPLHYYDVSLVDGFNLPVWMMPVGGGSAGCGVAACEKDVNACCPASLAVWEGRNVVACKSACLATGEAEYCCRGAYGSRETCKLTAYARRFKAVCPRAYSYAFDEASGLKTCRANRYLIQFCPPT